MHKLLLSCIAICLLKSCIPGADNNDAKSGRKKSDSLQSESNKEIRFDSVTGTYYEYSLTIERSFSQTRNETSSYSENQSGIQTENTGENPADKEVIEPAVKTAMIDWKRVPVRMPHHINTDVSEYYPCPLPDGKLLFTGMDRTGHFEYKIDYTLTRAAGGEDGYISGFSDGLPEDARPIPSNLNTSAHEAVTQVLPNGDFLMTANYQENLNSQGADQGTATPDLFIARNKTGRITHLPEPVNSLFGEYDGFMFKGEKAILFASDRPEGVGEYKKKGWLWNGNLWGNTDIYVAFMEEGEWGTPIPLGTKINTPYAERSPWLSPDGKTLFISTNAYSEGRNDLDVFMFTRTDITTWDQWTGPVKVVDVCSPGDDWCYRPDPLTGKVYFARSLPLKYKSSLPAREGDGYIRETGWRPGYTVAGAQAAALRKQWQTDIFVISDTGKPTFTLPDVLFDVDKYTLRHTASKGLDRLADLIDLNSKYIIELQGHTDNTGSESHNKNLSLNRAKAVMEYLVDQGIPASSIVVSGWGAKRPIAPNDSAANKQKNRRVDIYFRRP